MKNLYQKILSDSNSPDLQYLALKYYHKKKYSKAIKYFELLEKQQDYKTTVKYYLQMRTCYLNLKDFQIAAEYLIKADQIIQKNDNEYLETKCLLAEHYYNLSIATMRAFTVNSSDLSAIPEEMVRNYYYQAANYLELVLKLFSDNPKLLDYAILVGEIHGFQNFERAYIDTHIKIINIYTEILDDPLDKTIFYLEKLLTEYYFIFNKINRHDRDYLNYVIQQNKAKLKPSIHNQLTFWN